MEFGLLENKKAEITSNSKKQKRESTEESKSLLHIPHEIIDDILFRLPVKTLCRLKTVSRTWNSSILNLKFHTHSLTSIPKSSEGRFFRNITDEGTPTEKFPVPWDDSDSEVYVSNSCNGMLLICVGTCFYLFNPSTHYSVKVLTLNYACRGSYDRYEINIGLYYDETIRDFKAVVLIRYGFYSFGINRDPVLVVEASLKGKRWNHVDHTFKHGDVITVGPVVNGRIHWLVQEKLTRFDPISNVFEELPSFQPPPNHTEYSEIIGIGILEGCLCVSRIPDILYFEVLSMKEYGVSASWTPIFSFSHMDLNVPWNSFNPLLITRADEVLISMENVIYACNPGKRTVKQYHMGRKGQTTCAVSFVQNMDTLTGYYWNQTEHENFGNTEDLERIEKFWRKIRSRGILIEFVKVGDVSSLEARRSN